MPRWLYAGAALAALAAAGPWARRVRPAALALLLLGTVAVAVWATTAGRRSPPATATCRPASALGTDAGHLAADADRVTAALLSLAGQSSPAGLAANWQAAQAAVRAADRDYGVARARLAAARRPAPCGLREFITAFGDFAAAAGATVTDGLTLASGDGAAAHDLATRLGAMGSALAALAAALDQLVRAGP